MNNKPIGDNFPTYNAIHCRDILNKIRKDMVEKLLINQLGKITEEDILNMQIDIEVYNKLCRKEKIKKFYKQKKKK